MNPYNNLNTVACDTVVTDITQKVPDETATGWKFYTITGVLLANDGGTDPDGVEHAAF